MINEVIGSIFRLYLKNSLHVDMSDEWQAYISLGPPIYICKYVAKRSQDFQLNYVQLKGRYLEWQCRAALNLLVLPPTTQPLLLSVLLLLRFWFKMGVKIMVALRTPSWQIRCTPLRERTAKFKELFLSTNNVYCVID